MYAEFGNHFMDKLALVQNLFGSITRSDRLLIILEKENACQVLNLVLV